MSLSLTARSQTPLNTPTILSTVDGASFSTLTLIDPLRYGMLEQTYKGNSWNISQELEVTQQVLGDFHLAMSERVCII